LARWWAPAGARRPEVEAGSLRAGRYAYFPTGAIVSLVHAVSNGASAEVAVVGNEGIVGMSLFLGGTITTSQGSVLIPGQGFASARR
jgi:hypothetical protein